MCYEELFFNTVSFYVIHEYFYIQEELKYDYIELKYLIIIILNNYIK